MYLTLAVTIAILVTVSIARYLIILRFDAMSESPGWTIYFTIMILAFLFGNIWLGVIMIIAGIAYLVYDAAKCTSKEDS